MDRAEAAVGFIGNDPQKDVGGQQSLALFNADTMIEVDYEKLELQDSKLEYYQQLSDCLNSTVDDVKKAVGYHVWYGDHFKLFRFQLQLWKSGLLRTKKRYVSTTCRDVLSNDFSYISALIDCGFRPN